MRNFRRIENKTKIEISIKLKIDCDKHKFIIFYGEINEQNYFNLHINLKF